MGDMSVVVYATFIIVSTCLKKWAVPWKAMTRC